MRSLIAASCLALLCSAAWAAPVASDWSREPSQFEDEKNGFPLDELHAPPLGNSALRDALQAIQAGRPEAVAALVRDSLNRPDTAAPAHELLGIALAMQGHLARARAEFEQALRANPGQITAAIKLGDLAAAQGNLDEAERLYEQARAIDGGNRQLAQRLGVVAERHGDFLEAIDWYEKGLAGTPADYLGVRLNLAGLYNRTGQPKRTVALLAAHPRRDSSAAALFHLGVAHTQLGQFGVAVAELERARTIAPQLWNTALALGVAKRLAGDADASIASLREAARIAPRSPLPPVELGHSLLALGRADEAIAEFERAVRLSGDRNAYRLELAQAYLATGRNDQAIALFEALASLPDSPIDVGLGRAAAYRNAGRLDDAAKEYARLRRTAPQNAEVLYQAGLFAAYLRDYDAAVDLLRRAAEDPAVRARALRATGFAYGKKGDHAKAIATAREAVAASPDSADAHLTMALLLEQAGRRQEAARAYEDALKIEPSNVLALNNLAVLSGDAGDHEAALALAGRARAAAGHDPQVLDTWGWALHRVGRSEEAREALREAASQSPQSPTIRFHLGAARVATGEREAGREDLREALRSAPDADWASEARRLLAEGA